jgi:hypothetical protein
MKKDEGLEVQHRVMLRGGGGLVKLFVGVGLVPVPHMVKPVENIGKKSIRVVNGQGEALGYGRCGDAKTSSGLLPALAAACGE